MTGWDFQCALNEYKRNQEKLVEITEGLKDTFVSLKRQGDRAECYLKMQEKINKRLFKDELKRLPKHFHNAAATVYTNHSTREALFRVRNKDHYKLLEEVSELKRRNEHFIYHSNAYIASSEEYLQWWSTHFENENHDRPMPAVANKPNNCRHHGPQTLRPVKETRRCATVQHQRAPVKDKSPLRLSKNFNAWINS
jgi:hypothetical protein